jgi:hypothetical protein
MRVLWVAAGSDVGVALGGAMAAGMVAAAVALLYVTVRHGPTLLVAAGYVAFKWFSGGQWRHHYTGPRYVTRPVRAVGQTVLTVVAVAAWLNPLATVVVIGALAGALGVTVAVTRRWARPVGLPPLRARRVEPDRPRALASAAAPPVGVDYLRAIPSSDVSHR